MEEEDDTSGRKDFKCQSLVGITVEMDITGVSGLPSCDLDDQKLTWGVLEGWPQLYSELCTWLGPCREAPPAWPTDPLAMVSEQEGRCFEHSVTFFATTDMSCCTLNSICILCLCGMYVIPASCGWVWGQFCPWT